MPGPANGDHQVVGCGPRDGLRIPLDRPEHRERGSGVVRGDKDAMARQGRNERLRCRRQAGAKERETGRQRCRGGLACHREELRRDMQDGRNRLHIRVSRTVTENGSAGLEDEFESKAQADQQKDREEEAEQLSLEVTPRPRPELGPNTPPRMSRIARTTSTAWFAMVQDQRHDGRAQDLELRRADHHRGRNAGRHRGGRHHDEAAADPEQRIGEADEERESPKTGMTLT